MKHLELRISNQSLYTSRPHNSSCRLITIELILSMASWTHSWHFLKTDISEFRWSWTSLAFLWCWNVNKDNLRSRQGSQADNWILIFTDWQSKLSMTLHLRLSSPGFFNYHCNYIYCHNYQLPALPVQVHVIVRYYLSDILGPLDCNNRGINVRYCWP